MCVYMTTIHYNKYAVRCMYMYSLHMFVESTKVFICVVTMYACVLCSTLYYTVHVGITLK